MRTFSRLLFLFLVGSATTISSAPAPAPGPAPRAAEMQPAPVPPMQLPNPAGEVPVPRSLPSDEILAAQMLDADVGTPEAYGDEGFSKDRWVEVRNALLNVGIQREIIDPREPTFLFSIQSDFQADLDKVRKRNADLKDVPPLAYANRFPERSTLIRGIEFNRKFKENLQERLRWEPDRADILVATLRENEQLYAMWDAMRDARTDMYYTYARREAIQRFLRHAKAMEYPEHEAPPNVPVWRFATR